MNTTTDPIEIDEPAGDMMVRLGMELDEPLAFTHRRLYGEHFPIDVETNDHDAIRVRKVED